MSPGKFALVWAASCTTLWGAILALASQAHGSLASSAADRGRGPLVGPGEGVDGGALAAALAQAEPFGSDADGGALAEGSADGGPSASASPGEPGRTPLWRVADLAQDPAVVIVPGTMGKHTFLAAMTASGVSARDAFRIIKAFAGARQFERCGAHDTFTIARDRSSRKLVAFEYATSPLEVWQARAGDDGELTGKKLAFDISTKRDDVAFVVGDDLRSSVQKIGLDDDLLATLDDALEGHAELADIHPGARLRVIATESRVEGVFAGFASVDAVEYFPATAGAQPVRVYKFPAGDDAAAATDHAGTKSESKKSEPRAGYYDARGRQPFRGGWHAPVPLARISSRFNPRRMHPVLHVIKPHNGVDFAASSGTPVYAAASGTVEVAGNGGACGNMVKILHPSSGLVTAYCHLSRFAPGIHAGDHVEGRQLIGFVGQTGRATGPHLHFAVKRGNAFVDPLGLKLDGVRVVPPAERDAFDKQRASLDAELDAIPLPAAPANLPPASDADGGLDDPSAPADEADMLEEGNGSPP
jgi:murein DD-endopeptidase MepM/ murein hydrolase activator NlpD